jgi:hypothetical protein
LLSLFFDPENGGDMFLQNASSLSTDNRTLYPRRQYPSSIKILRITASSFGPCPSSGIVEARKHNVLETGFVSALRWGGGRDT